MFVMYSVVIFFLLPLKSCVVWRDMCQYKNTINSRIDTTIEPRLASLSPGINIFLSLGMDLNNIRLDLGLWLEM